MNNDSLQKEFLGGSLPQKLEGFYQGKLAMLFPRTLAEGVLSLLAEIWVPWKGKYFYGGYDMGDNILPGFLMHVLRFQYGDAHTGGSQDGLFHAFPFKTAVFNGLSDPVAVLQLNYDLVQNPPLLRQVIDELVCVGTDTFLGKMYMKQKDSFRLVGYFRLRRSH